MPIILDYHLQEQIPHAAKDFPAIYYHDELASLPDWAGPFHWHTDFEIASAISGVLDFQIGQQHIILNKGDSIFINRNVLHRIKQLSGDTPDSMPNIVFSNQLIASDSSIVYQKYIHPIAQCEFLPFVVFSKEDESISEIHHLILENYQLMKERKPCYELGVQRNISRIFEFIFLNFERFSKSEATYVQINSQVRLQKMLTYIYENYAKEITLEDIANAADISRSEAGRCFNQYMGCSPVSVLIQYRLQMAHQMMNKRAHTLQQISNACGFNSVNYFSRQFKKKYGYAPSRYINMGK